jgi:hypothetical protein
VQANASENLYQFKVVPREDDGKGEEDFIADISRQECRSCGFWI